MWVWYKMYPRHCSEVAEAFAMLRLLCRARLPIGCCAEEACKLKKSLDFSTGRGILLLQDFDRLIEISHPVTPQNGRLTSIHLRR